MLTNFPGPRCPGSSIAGRRSHFLLAHWHGIDQLEKLCRPRGSLETELDAAILADEENGEVRWSDPVLFA
jgi:hypothetical protein